MKKISFAVLVGLVALLALPAAVTRYVDAVSTNPTPPYTNWQTAAKLIIDAVKVSADGDAILVTNGTHSGQFPHIPLTNAIALISVNGCHATTVTCTTMRGFYLGHTGAVVDGFTVINALGAHGGGAIVETGTLRNCVFVNCLATNGDGGDQHSGRGQRHQQQLSRVGEQRELPNGVGNDDQKAHHGAKRERENDYEH